MTLGVCPLCKGLMRVFTKELSENTPFRVRCPHCEVVLAVDSPPPQNITEMSDKEKALSARRQETEYTFEAAEDNRSKSLNWAEYPDFWDEEEIPESALFPAEKDAGTSVGTWMKSTLRTLLWIIVSVGVIVIFALIVNLVLPGPAGQRGASGFKPPSMEKIHEEPGR